MLAVYSDETSGVIQEFNHRAAESWGRDPASGDTDERFCDSFKLIRPDGSFMPHEQCPMAEVLSGKIAEARDAEVLIERPDGSQVTVIVNIRPLKNQRGEVKVAVTGMPMRFVNEAVSLGRWFDVYAFRLGGSEMVRLVDDLLDVSRISRSTVELRRGRIEPVDVLKHTCITSI